MSYQLKSDIISLSTFTILGALLICYVLSAIHSWHRLRAFPVPTFSSSFSYLWMAYTTFVGKQYWLFRDVNQHYGPLVRIGPNMLLTDDPTILRKISSTRSTYNRDSFYLTGRFNPYLDNIFTILEPAAHNKVKARTISAYSGKDLAEFEPGIDNQVRTLLKVIHERYTSNKRTSTPPLLNLADMSNFFTMDVITNLGFGHAFGYLHDEFDHHDFLETLRTLWPYMSTSANVPWIGGVLHSRTFLKLFGPKTTDKTGFGALMAAVERYVGERFQSNAEERQDMLGSLMRHGLNQQECEAEGLLMIIAGAESTAAAIRSILIHTITTPSIYQKLKQEIRLAASAGKVSNPISYEEAKKLPYLQAVIYEGLRIRPPIMGLFPKVVPAGGDEFHGKFVPQGTAICMNMASYLRSTKLFGMDADVFRPERFMTLDKSARSEMERNVELAFGYGQWMCMGKTVAFMEMNKAVFELLRAFDLQLINPTRPSNIYSYGVFLENDLLVKVTESE